MAWFLIISLCIFMGYFYAIWLWYLWIIPLLLCIAFFVLSIWWLWKKNMTNSLFNDYGLFFAWIVILIWLFLILKFFWLSVEVVFLSLIVLNLLLMIWSYFFHYKDGKQVWQIWFYVVVAALLIYTWIVFGFNVFFDVFTLVWLLYLAIIWFVALVLGMRYEVDKSMYYILLVLICGAIALALYNLIPNIYVFLIVLCLGLAWLYSYIYYVITHKPPTQNQVQEISVRRILAWERVLKKIPHHNVKSQKIYNFVDEMPQFVKYILEFANTLVILILIYLYFKNALSLKWSIEQIFYWIVMILFVFNVYLQKKIDYTSILQNLFTYMVINFAIYISLFAAFSGDVSDVVLWWIVWNLISSALIFRIHDTKIGKYLRKIDYLFWIFTTVLALIVNVILLCNTWMSGGLLFPTILLYIWIQGMLLYYSIRYVNKIQEVEVTEN